MENCTPLKATSHSTEEKVSPFDASYYGSDPSLYIEVGLSRQYNPTCPDLPINCKTVLDCAVLFGNSSLSAMYGWEFPRICEFWKANIPLSDEQRSNTLLNKKIKVIGLDSRQAALNYTKQLNIIDEGILQNFEEEMSSTTRSSLIEADVWILQQCLSYMPFSHLQTWLTAFLSDRTRPKRFIYDFNPYFDNRNMTPEVILEDFSGWEVSMQKFYSYRQKTEEEYATSQENGRDMCVHHYVIDFAVAY